MAYGTFSYVNIMFTKCLHLTVVYLSIFSTHFYLHVLEWGGGFRVGKEINNRTLYLSS